MMEHNVLYKVIVALAVVVSLWLDFRPNKRVVNANPVIAAADARERHAWRYARWALRGVQITLGIYLLWTAVRFILTSPG